MAVIGGWRDALQPQQPRGWWYRFYLERRWCCGGAAPEADVAVAAMMHATSGGKQNVLVWLCVADWT